MATCTRPPALRVVLDARAVVQARLRQTPDARAASALRATLARLNRQAARLIAAGGACAD